MDEVFGTTRQTSRSDLIWAAVVGLGAAVTFTGAQAFRRILLVPQNNSLRSA